jgi:cob(I)alamin adenosyltransferase
VPKWHPCIEFAGALDEAEASLAYARTLSERAGLNDVAEVLAELEELLFRIGFTAAGRRCIRGEDVEHVEKLEALLAAETVRMLDSFRLNGATVEAAAIAVARTAVRRAERRFWQCLRLRSGVYRDTIVAGQLLNRISDLLYLLQLKVDKRLGREPPRVKCKP